MSLERQLDRLPPGHRVAFAAACCERLLPNYAAFAREVGWGEPATLRSAVDYVWSVLAGGTWNHGEIDRFIKRCDAAIPDTEDFETILVSGALDAGTAVVQTLRALLDGDPKRIVDVASFCRDTVDMYIQNRDQLDYDTDPSFEERIEQDPLMTRELARQSATLTELAANPVLDGALLQRIRAESADGGRSNIGRRADGTPSD
jgi:uncharacterized protein YjaG (DUF416 family)